MMKLGLIYLLNFIRKKSYLGIVDSHFSILGADLDQPTPSFG